MNKNTEADILFYKREIQKWENLARAVMQDKLELLRQVEELRAEVQRLSQLAKY